MPDDLTTSATIPRAALLLGMAGVLPFAATALQIATGWPLGPRLIGPALYWMSIYAAAILAFMGGVQWGLAVGPPTSSAATDWRRYGLSVLPSFAACLGLYLGARSGLLTFVAGFIVLLAYDLWTVSQGEAPAWYGRLRTGLTAAVVVCLLAAAQLGPF